MWLWEVYRFKRAMMHSHQNITTDNEAPENASLNIFCLKWDIYFHFTKWVQSTTSIHSHNCKHLIRNCDNELNVKKPHLLPKLLFAVRVLSFCTSLNKKGQGSFSACKTSWEETACTHMLGHSSSSKQSGCIPPAAWKRLLNCVNPWVQTLSLTRTKTTAGSTQESQDYHRIDRMVPNPFLCYWLVDKQGLGSKKWREGSVQKELLVCTGSWGSLCDNITPSKQYADRGEAMRSPDSPKGTLEPWNTF